MKELLKQRRVWIGLLAIAHLPFLFIHYLRLWQIEHYQYFPFALGIFAFLVRSRKGKTSDSLSLPARILLAMDVLLLTTGAFLNSPWLVCCGAVCLCFALCSAIRDIETEGSLAYLAVLPLVTVRLPLGMDIQLIQLLQRATTRVASNILNHLGYLHYRDGNVLNFADRQFMIEEACSGVQSLFTVLFLATLIICGYRRKLAHTVVLLCSAVVFAGVMNVIRVVAISVAWQGYAIDLSTGWQHDAIGYAALILASSLVYGTDLFVALMFAAVKLEPGKGRSSSFHNPVTHLWNSFFQAPKQKRTGKTPRLADLLKPSNLFGWTFNFIGNWFASRDKKLVPASVLFLLIVPGSCGFVWWLETSPKADLVTTYEESLMEAARANDSKAKSIYLQSLVRLRPTNNHYRFQLAMHQLDCEQTGLAISQLEHLTTPGRNDHAAARIWLARQALSNAPTIPLDDDQIEGHLLMALEMEPRNIEAKRLIGEVLLKKGHLKAAEDYFLDAVKDDPSFAFSLARIQTKLGRSPEQVRFHLDVAIDFFQKRLMKNPQLVSERIRLSRCFVLAGQLADAERVLSEGLSTNNSDTPELRTALSDYYVDLSNSRLNQSVFNRDMCASMVKQAIKLSPSNRKAVLQAITLNSLGAKFEASSLQPAVDSLRALEQPTKADQTLIVQTLVAGGQLNLAIDELRPLTIESPEMNIVLARLLRSNGQTEESNALVSQLLTDFAPTADSTDMEAILGYVDVLNMAQKFSESRELLNTAAKQQPEMDKITKAKWNVVSGQTAIANYDYQMQQKSFRTAKDALDILDTAWAAGTVRQSVLKRLALLSCSDNSFAEQADAVLGDLLVNANVTPDVYNMVGSQAIRSKQFDKAKVYLERAFRLTRGNPMVLNNLALALVRSSSPDHERALQLTQDALVILPDHPDVLSTRAEVFVAMKRWEEARGDLEESLQERPDDTDSRRLLAKVCDEMGETSLADNHRRKVSEIESMLD